MANYTAIPPVTLTFTVTLDGQTTGGKCRAVKGSEILVRASGTDAEFFKIAVTKWGDLLPIDTRLSKNPEDRRVAVASAPAKAPAKVPTRGKGKAAVAPAPAAAAPAAPDMAAMFAMFQQFMAGQK